VEGCQKKIQESPAIANNWSGACVQVSVRVNSKVGLHVLYLLAIVILFSTKFTY